MKVKAIQYFHDLEANVNRGIGEIFEVTEERLKAINGTDNGALVEKAEIPGKKSKTAEKPAEKAE